MDAEKEQADSLCITMVVQLRQPRDKLCTTEHTVAVRVSSQFSTILFRSKRNGKKKVKSRQVSKELYERNDKIKPLWSLRMLYRSSILRDTCLRLFCFDA